MDLKNSRVLVFGAGKSGIAAAKLLLGVPAVSIILYDGNEKLDKEELLEMIAGAHRKACAGQSSDTETHAGEAPGAPRLQVILGELPVRGGAAEAGSANAEDAKVTADSANAKNINIDADSDDTNDARGGFVVDSPAGEVSIDLAILSPGVPTDLPLVARMRACSVRIWGEVELAWECGRGDVLAVTGTNGKTTTTSLLGEIMRDYVESADTAAPSDAEESVGADVHTGEGGLIPDSECAAGDDVRRVYVVGNIGNPYTEAAPRMTDHSITVAEISSFQLETIERFAPKVSAILNITPDHLNRHHTMEEYIRVKELITRNQGSADTCVLNYEDEILREFGKTLQTRVIYFSSLHKLDRGMYLDGENICFSDGDDVTVLCSTKELNIPGRHNHENVMAAAAMAYAYGVPFASIRKTVCAFQAVEHRIEYVTEKKGVVYYNDSKGTNPDAAIKGIQAMDRPTLLIGGGYDKNSSYEEWIRSFDGKVKYLVLIGQTREKIAEAAAACGFENCILEDSLEDAVAFCASHAKSGDAVLLSPACASWGMFPNYEVRGRRFKELVNALEG
ncbi:MAG: UDP-N-acetylmuramoyl-L-alanine--D-glutamate ligase [Lachnospiraceae bacterium]|nr:UDP-N-acetylmuramoyl-L-alanine--D-glutamate ligase [Lachnospiraceae bacterium]